MTKNVYLFLMIFLVILLFPLGSRAGTYTAIECPSDYIYDSEKEICYEKDHLGDPAWAEAPIIYTVYYKGLVPCGKAEYCSLERGCVRFNGEGEFIGCFPQCQPFIFCQPCHAMIMIDGIVDFILFKILPPLAVLMMVIGGILFFFSAENPENVERGRRVLTSVILGLIVIFSAWLLVNLFLRIIGVADWTGLSTGWFNINCPIVISPVSW